MFFSIIFFYVYVCIRLFKSLYICTYMYLFLYIWLWGDISVSIYLYFRVCDRVYVSVYAHLQMQQKVMLLWTNICLYIFDLNECKFILKITVS